MFVRVRPAWKEWGGQNVPGHRMGYFGCDWGCTLVTCLPAAAERQPGRHKKASRGKDELWNQLLRQSARSGPQGIGDPELIALQQVRACLEFPQ